MPGPRKHLRLETLEDRSVPATFGVAWPDAGHLTLSFVPDNTSIAGHSSRLFNGFPQSISASGWQNEILRAFQTWAATANVNIGLVSDDGSAFGSPGPTQGSPQYGDVRIGLRDLSPNMFAASVPFDWGDTWSGDIVLNGAVWGSANRPDLFTVMLQEAGHVLGVGNSTDKASVMYDVYTGPKKGLTTVDIGRLQSMYGPRLSDRFEGSKGNGSTDNATTIDFTAGTDPFSTDDSEGRSPAIVEADLTTMSDVDFYRFETPSGTTSFKVALRSSGISLLKAKLTVYDDDGHKVPAEVVAGTAEGDLVLSVPNARSRSTYHVKVQRATDDVFGIGAYRLAVGGRATEAMKADLAPDFVSDNGWYRNDTLSRASKLEPASKIMDYAQDAVTRATISTATDVDFYAITAPAAPKGSPTSLVTTVWAQDGGKFRPVVSVFDKDGKPVAARVHFDRNGVYSIVVPNVVPKQKYYIRVASSEPANAAKAGDYMLSIDFRPEVVRETTFVTGVLSQEQKQDFRTLTMVESQLFHFELADANLVEGPVVGLRMTLYNSKGKAVFTMTSTDGRAALGDVWLEAGTYTVRIVAGTADGSLLGETGFRLAGEGRSDSVGLETEDPLLNPIPPPGTPPPDTPPNSGQTGTLPSYVFTTYEQDYYAAIIGIIGVDDPYSNPWWN